MIFPTGYGRNTPELGGSVVGDGDGGRRAVSRQGYDQMVGSVLQWLQ
jgi:hypothetical protein